MATQTRCISAWVAISIKPHSALSEPFPVPYNRSEAQKAQGVCFNEGVFPGSPGQLAHRYCDSLQLPVDFRLLQNSNPAVLFMAIGGYDCTKPTGLEFF